MKTKIIVCKTCGKQKQVSKYVTRTYCSKSCKNNDPDLIKRSNAKRKNTWDSKYGGHPMSLKQTQQNHKRTMKNKYGVSHALQKKSFLDKAKQTKLSLYGDENYNNIQKGVKTRLDRYGKLNNNEEYNLKRRLLKYSWEHVNILDDITTCDLTKPVQVQCTNCKRVWRVCINNNYTPSCGCLNSPISSSQGQREVYEYILSLVDDQKTDVKFNSRELLSNRELDIYIPNLNLAFEYNGLYWHSEKNKSKQYHLDKTKRCIIQGVQLVHILEYYWINRQDVVKSMICNRLQKTPTRFYGRNCTVDVIPPKVKKQFLNENHLHGNCNSSINLGLFHQGELVSVATFGKPRFNKKFTYELLRFANLKFTNVVGGFSKILAYFKANYEFESLLSYADRDWSIGGVYRENGFRFIGSTPPNYVYVKNSAIYPRQMFQKHKLESVLDNYDQTLTENQNMNKNGYYRLYNTGNLKFALYQQKES